MLVELSAFKSGYYRISDDGTGKTPRSSEVVHYLGSTGESSKYSHRETPVVLALFEIGQTDNPVHRKISEKIPSNGEVVYIPLAGGSEDRSYAVAVKSIKNITSKKDLEKLYDWEFELSIPGGGFVERKGELDFDAPAEGYEATVRFVVSKDDPTKWSRSIRKSYFIRFGDGTHATWSVSMSAGFNNSISGDVYFNPKVGSRNLRFAPK